jgi:hypothetical protein
MEFLQEIPPPVRVLCIDDFLKELKKAPEWMIYGQDGVNHYIILRVRDKPMGPWTEYWSPDPITMTPEEWLDFTQTIELFCEIKRQDRRPAKPEAYEEMPETRTIG